MSVIDQTGVLGARPVRRRWWLRVFRLCVAVVAASGAVAVGGITGLHIAKTHPVPLGLTKPGITLAATEQPNFSLTGPFVAHFGNSYYMYLSSSLGSHFNIPMVSGSSPGHWDWATVHDALPTAPAFAYPFNGSDMSGQMWEPQVFQFGSTYVMYMSPTVITSSIPVGGGLNHFPHCIGMAYSHSPAGPFIPSPQPFVCQINLGGDIDAQAFYDPSGPNGPLNPYYLLWKSDNNNLTPPNPDAHPTDIWVQGLANDGMSLTGQPVKIFWASEPWQQGLVEAPQFYMAPGGTIYLFYSGGTCFCGPGYGMGVARCTSVLGPCKDLSPTPLIASNEQGEGPGEETVYPGPNGSVWLVYNAWYNGDINRNFFQPVEAALIRFGPSGPYVAKPPKTFGP